MEDPKISGAFDEALRFLVPYTRQRLTTCLSRRTPPGRLGVGTMQLGVVDRATDHLLSSYWREHPAFGTLIGETFRFVDVPVDRAGHRDSVPDELRRPPECGSSLRMSTLGMASPRMGSPVFTVSKTTSRLEGAKPWSGSTSQ